MARNQCSPHEADWCVEIIVGTTFCPEVQRGKKCFDRSAHDRQYGTDTSDNYGFFKGERPGNPELDSMTPDGWYRIETKIRRTP